MTKDASVAVAEARHLLADVLARARRRGSVELPMPVLASEQGTSAARDYLVWWIRHPNPTGTFAAQTRWLRRLPDRWLVRWLFGVGYDGLLYLAGDRIIGHSFFQRRGATVHGFSMAVDAPFAGRGHSMVLILDYVAYTSRMPGVERVRIGRGQNNLTRRSLQRLKQHERELRCRVDPDGWVNFVDAAASSTAFRSGRTT